jgi:hypothetical protein
MTNLPDSAILKDVLGRMEELLSSYANAPAAEGKSNVVEAVSRFK